MSQQNKLKEELDKIKDPISGNYYFYLNYFTVKDKDGNELPKLSEEQFNKEMEAIKRLPPLLKKRRR